MDPVTLAAAKKYARLDGIPESVLGAWDDFQPDSADLNGRSTPDGTTWDTVDDDGATATGVASVAGGEAVFTSATAYRWARLPVSSANGVLLLATVRKIAASGSVVFRYGVWDANGDYVAVDPRSTTSGAGVRFVKRISGTETTLSTENVTEYGDPSFSAAAIIQPIQFGVQVKSAGSAVAIGYEHPGATASAHVTDAEAISVIDNATHVGLAAYRDGRIGNVRVLEAG